MTFLVCSFASVSIGFHYRNHYFITLLPALSLLAAVAVSRAVHLLAAKVRTLELFAALPLVATFGIAVIVSLTFDAPVWFGLNTEKAEMQVYHTTEQREAADLAKYLRDHAAKDARIAVIGSEPQIPFLAHRLSATGYIYMYPLMEDQPYAEKMQEEMIREIEKNRPDYVVYVNDDLSWLRKPNSLGKIDDWWKSYWQKNLELINTIPIEEWHGDTPDPVAAMNRAGDAKCLLLLKRKASATQTN